MTALPEKYRPRTLSDILGQPAIVAALQAWLKNPYPCAFLFAGPTGTGKTSAALALAHDLGIATEQDGFAGFYSIASGEQTGESVRRAVECLHFRPMAGGTWKMLLVNEADKMSPGAAFVWLDVLESIPPNSVIVFTTNNIEEMDRRLRDRFEVHVFEGDAGRIAADGQALVNRVWKAETGRDDAPLLACLGEIADETGNASFRRILQLLAPVVRTGALPNLPAKPETALWWIIGGALALAVGALTLAALAIGESPPTARRAWSADDLLR